MNTTATKKFALATLAAPVLAALAIGLAGTAHADSSSPETTVTVQDQGACGGAQVQTQTTQGTVTVQDQGACGGARVQTQTTQGTVTVQDQDAIDGARAQTQAIQGTLNSSGTQGTSKPATDGTTTGPLVDAVPQYTAG